MDAETTYAYAIIARNAHGLGPQSDAVPAVTTAAPAEAPVAEQLPRASFTLDGQALDTSGTCSDDDIASVPDDCTVNITTRSPVFAVHGTVDSDDRMTVRIGRDSDEVDAATATADQDDLRGADQTATLTLAEGRHLLRLWADEDTSSGGSEEHFFRINVLPYWDLNSEQLSKDNACRSTSNPDLAAITDGDCIVTQAVNTGTLRFHNVTTDHFNVYVSVNGNEIIREPDDASLGGPFTVELQAGDNLLRVRLASKGNAHRAESYGNDAFYYKITTPSPPAKPRITGQGAGHSTAFLTWADPGDDSIAGYQILRGEDTDTLTVLVHDTGSAETGYTDETVEPETEYFYAIKAWNTVGLSPQSDTVSTTTQAATPAAAPSSPTGLTGFLQDDYSVVLDWDNTAAATSYQLSYRHFHLSEWVDLPVAGITVNVNGSAANVSRLGYPLNYYFRVRSSNSSGDSDWSTEELVAPTPIVNNDGCTVETPPTSLSDFDKYCSAGGIGIVGSDKTSDFAMKLAWNQVMNMLAANPTLHQRMANDGVHHQVDAALEEPETPRYDAAERHTRSPEQNMLCYPEANRFNYSFLVHEFAHAIEYAGLSDVERQEVSNAYDLAMQDGIWQGKYGANDLHEYWAEAVEAYFSDASRGLNFNHQELVERDPRIYGILLKYLPANGWRVNCPAPSETPPPPAKPPMPRNLQATNTTETTVTLSWDIPESEGSNVQSYEIMRSHNEGQSRWPTGNVDATQTTFTVTELTADSSYWFAIEANNGYRRTRGSWVSVQTLQSENVQSE